MDVKGGFCRGVQGVPRAGSAGPARCAVGPDEQNFTVRATARVSRDRRPTPGCAPTLRTHLADWPATGSSSASSRFLNLLPSLPGRSLILVTSGRAPRLLVVRRFVLALISDPERGLLSRDLDLHSRRQEPVAVASLLLHAALQVLEELALAWRTLALGSHPLPSGLVGGVQAPRHVTEQGERHCLLLLHAVQELTQLNLDRLWTVRERGGSRRVLIREQFKRRWEQLSKVVLIGLAVAAVIVLVFQLTGGCSGTQSATLPLLQRPR